jgi:hypothetical protein
MCFIMLYIPAYKTTPFTFFLYSFLAPIHFQKNIYRECVTLCTINAMPPFFK